MKAYILSKKSIVMALGTLAMVMGGLFLYDGSSSEALAFTTPDCRVCHGDSAATAVRHHSIPRGCPSCHRTGTPTPGNPDHPDRNCLNCHYPNSIIYLAVDVTTAHTQLHDMTVFPSVDCADCHTPAAIGEHEKYPTFNPDPGNVELDCDRCHKNTNTDPALGPINVQETIAKGSSGGVEVTCDECHTNIAGAGHAAAHNNVFPNSIDCTAANCHNANVMTEHTDRGWTCGTCHNGETLTLDPAVVLQVIADSRGPYNPATSAYCTDCHGPDAGTHVAAHNQGFFLETPTGQDCTRCHAAMDTSVDPNQANLVVEHVSNQGLTCGTCHDRTDHVFDAINKGREPSNMPVYCVDCHTDATSGQGKGHAPVIVEPWSECTWCHTLDIFDYPEHTVHLAAARDLQKDCSVCHVPAGTRPDCIGCHSLDQTIWDPLPIHRTAPNNSLNIIGPGTEDHDKHTSGIDCSYCHVSGVPGSEPLPEPYSECSKCHNGSAATDITYGSQVHTVNHIQGAEAAGQSCSYCHSQTPACTDCHDIAGPTKPKHDFHTNPPQSIDCAECHVSGVPGGTPIPPPYNECSTCHDGTGGTINIKYGQPGHNAHMAAASFDCNVCHTAQPNCGQCHSAGDHIGAHDNAGVPSTGCLNCHDANVVVEHVENRGYTCDTCHGSTDQKVIDAITAGKNGTFVYCYDCHGQNNHHATAESQSGNCTYCHADPRLDVQGAAVPTGQLACRQCHGTNQHGNGGPIQDYGACFACHQPAPYHAKPTAWPGWYEEYQPASGRETFNLFHDEFQPSCAGDCESQLKRLNGYGEHRDPAEINDRNWRSPSISYTMVTVFDFFGTNQQWTVPTFGSGGGTPPPQADSVNITRAEYKDRRVTVYAENSLGHTNVSLSVMYNNNSYPMTWDSGDNRWEVRISTYSCNDSTIEVVSSAGGSDSSSVSNCSSYSSGWSH